jgi:hypothetical protein
MIFFTFFTSILNSPLLHFVSTPLSAWHNAITVTAWQYFKLQRGQKHMAASAAVTFLLNKPCNKEVSQLTHTNL